MMVIIKILGLSVALPFFFPTQFIEDFLPSELDMNQFFETSGPSHWEEISACFTLKGADGSSGFLQSSAMYLPSV